MDRRRGAGRRDRRSLGGLGTARRWYEHGLEEFAATGIAAWIDDLRRYGLVSWRSTPSWVQRRDGWVDGAEVLEVRADQSMMVVEVDAAGTEVRENRAARRGSWAW